MEQKILNLTELNELLTSLNDQWFTAKETVMLGEQADLANRLRKPSDDTVKAKIELKKLDDAIADTEKKIAKIELDNKNAELLAGAKELLNTEFGIDDTYISEILADNADAKKRLETVKMAFNTVFGKIPVIAKENQTGSSLAKQNVNVADNNGKINVTKAIKEKLTAGTDAAEIVNFLLNDGGFDDETKAKKRLNDVKWAWEIENGLREKPAKK